MASVLENRGASVQHSKTGWEESEVKQERRKEKEIFARLIIGHTSLHTLYKTGKHSTGKCAHCNQPETVGHVILHKVHNAEKSSFSLSDI